MKDHALKIAKFLIGWPLSLLALFFIWRTISPQAGSLISNIKNINIPLLAIGIGCFLPFYFLRSFIWYKLLEDHSHHIPFKHTTMLWAMAEIKRYLPGKFWFVLGRTVAFSEKGVSKKDVGMLLFIELQFFAIGAFLVSLLSLPFLAKYIFPAIHLTMPLQILIIIASFALVLLYAFNKYLVHNLPPKTKKIISTVLPQNHPAMIIFLVFISSITLLFYGLASYFTIISFTFLNPQLIPQLVGFFTLSFLLGFLSFVTPAGLGIREGIMAIGLAKIISLTQAAFASLLVRVIQIISELLFIFLVMIWEKIKNKKILTLEKWIANHRQESVLICLFLVYCAYFTVTSFLRYDNFYTGRFDLGNMAQTVWNTSRGRIFQFTNPNSTATVSRLAFHADFILILLAPFYYLWTNPKMLLLIQTLIVAAGVFFVYAIANDVLKNKNLALTFAFLYVINPSIERTNLYDFHPVTMATCFLLGAYYFYRKKRYIFFSLFALLAALTKEEIWLITGLFGVFIFFFQNKKILGAAIFSVSVFLFYFLIWHAIPQALGSQHFALAYYSDFGDSPGKIIKNTIFSPQKTITTIIDPSRLNYLNQIFSPLGYLSLLAPWFLLFAIPDLLINLLSNNQQLHQIYYQYTAPINPFLFITAILGLSWLKKITKLSNILLISVLLIVSLTTAYFLGPLPGAVESNLDMFTRPISEKDQIDAYLSHIHKHFSVAASNNVGSHLSQRQMIYTLQQGIGKADIIVFLLTDPSTVKSEKEMVQKLKQYNQYYIDLETDTFIVFRKKGV